MKHNVDKRVLKHGLICTTKYGAPQKCPKCGGWNMSGLSLPEKCYWCSANVDNGRQRGGSKYETG